MTRKHPERIGLEMPTQNETERIAAAIHQLRPDWPARSLITWINRNQAHRPYQDLALALTWIATDPETKTPDRANYPGPWWQTNPLHATTSSPERYEPPPKDPDAIPCPPDFRERLNAAIQANQQAKKARQEP